MSDETLLLRDSAVFFGNLESTILLVIRILMPCHVFGIFWHSNDLSSYLVAFCQTEMLARAKQIGLSHIKKGHVHEFEIWVAKVKQTGFATIIAVQEITICDCHVYLFKSILNDSDSTAVNQTTALKHDQINALNDMITRSVADGFFFFGSCKITPSKLCTSGSSTVRRSHDNRKISSQTLFSCLYIFSSLLVALSRDRFLFI